MNLGDLADYHAGYTAPYLAWAVAEGDADLVAELLEPHIAGNAPAPDWREPTMRREERFILSHRPYAVDLSSLRVDGTYARVDAVWYRRRRGVTVACIGYLWDYQDATPRTAAEFLAHHDDGRYGGTCEGRWDGERYWGAQEPDVIERHLAILRPMLDSLPTIPDGYDGWWTFMQKGTR